MLDPTHGGRVEREADETAVGNALGDKLAEQNLPAIFASGKTVVGSHAGSLADGQFLTLRFDDGSEMTISGVFRVEASQPLAEEAI